MPLFIVRNDITKMKTDAIVNAANCSLLGGGGVDGCIHRAAGPELVRECATLGGCETGSAKITHAYRLPCKYVIHAVGPRWRGGSHGEREKLASCYRTSLAIAKEYKCESVAFPLISSGIYGYPKDRALKVAVDTITEFLLDNDMTVYIVVFDRRAYDIGAKLFADISSYIDDRYVGAHEAHEKSRAERMRTEMPRYLGDFGAPAMGAPVPGPAGASLEEVVKHLGESFSEMLLRKISESGMTDSQCYKKANIDRRLFSKIRSNKNYKPAKSMALAFAIALKMPIAEAKELLGAAGLAFSPSNKGDVIVEYFIEKKNYNIFEINEALFAFGEDLLGA